MVDILDAQYEENLTFDTNVLISENCLSDKYMSAKILNIPVLSY